MREPLVLLNAAKEILFVVFYLSDFLKLFDNSYAKSYITRNLFT